jgi:hypothetical protein
MDSFLAARSQMAMSPAACCCSTATFTSMVRCSCLRAQSTRFGATGPLKRSSTTLQDAVKFAQELPRTLCGAIQLEIERENQSLSTARQFSPYYRTAKLRISCPFKSMPLSLANINSNTPMGATLVPGGATFKVWGPLAQAVYLNGTFGSAAIGARTQTPGCFLIGMAPDTGPVF